MAEQDFRTRNSSQLVGQIVNPLRTLPPMESRAPTSDSDRNPAEVLHNSIWCDGLLCAKSSTPIKGKRYKCKVCKNVDLCSTCVRDRESGHDSTHLLLECSLETIFTNVFSDCAHENNSTEGLNRHPQPVVWSESPSAKIQYDVVDIHYHPRQAARSNFVATDLNDENVKNMIIGTLSRTNADLQTVRIDVSFHLPEADQSDRRGEPAIHHTDEETTSEYLDGKMKHYHYPQDQFHLDAWEGVCATRVIDLLPGLNDARLECKIRPIRPGETWDYETLSYTWQETSYERALFDNTDDTVDKAFRAVVDLRHPVYIGSDRYLAISTGLRDALRRLRHPTQMRTLWVDQICIDQRNVSERNFQVQNMGVIYNHAKQVIVWTGESDANTTSVFNILTTLGRLCILAGKETPTPQEAAQNSSLNLPPFNSPDWTSVVDFFARPVFQRTWVIQEVVLSKFVIVKCGEHEMDWRELVSVAHMFRRPAWVVALSATPAHGLQVPRGDYLPRFECTRAIQGFRERFHQGTRSELSGLLQMSRQFRLTDPKDRVYALMGLFSGYPETQTSKSIIPDYRKSIAQVYTEAARLMLEGERSLTILGNAGTALARQEGLPTWAADWSSDVEVSTLNSADFFKPEGMEDQYRASGDSQYSVSWPYIGEPNVLKTPSFCVGYVTAVGKPGLTQNKGRTRFDDSLIFANWAGVLGSRQQPYPGKSDPMDAYLCTLLADAEIQWSSRPAPESYKLHLAARMLDYALRSAPVDQRPFMIGRIPFLQDLVKLFKNDYTPGEDSEGDKFSYIQFRVATDYRNFFVADSGHIGLGPADIAVDDEIHIFPGARTPFILRRRDQLDGQRQRYALVGEAYVHDIMNGECLAQADFRWEDLEIC